MPAADAARAKVTRGMVATRSRRAARQLMLLGVLLVEDHEERLVAQRQVGHQLIGSTMSGEAASSSVVTGMRRSSRSCRRADSIPCRCRVRGGSPTTPGHRETGGAARRAGVSSPGSARRRPASRSGCAADAGSTSSDARSAGDAVPAGGSADRGSREQAVVAPPGSPAWSDRCDARPCCRARHRAAALFASRQVALVFSQVAVQLREVLASTSWNSESSSRAVSENCWYRSRKAEASSTPRSPVCTRAISLYSS